MDQHEGLAQRFEAQRGRLRGVAYRMLGSLGEAEDAVQEAWLRLGRADSGGIDNLEGWLTTVVARVCLDILRSRQSRGEQPLDDQAPDPDRRPAPGPPEEALLAAPAALRGGPSGEVRGAQAVAKLFPGRAQTARAALVNGAVGVVVAPRGRLFLVLGLKISAGKISEVEVIADPARLRRLDLAVLDG